MNSTDTKLTDTDMTGGLARTVDQATTSAHKVIDRASNAARPAVDRVAASAHHAVDKLAEAASDAADTINTRGGQVLDAQARVADNCRGYVRDRPMTSLGIAAAAGLLLGWALSRR